jgi:tRNA pseudouridine32 synthase/23S rRNA pseudouridine746 synthase
MAALGAAIVNDTFYPEPADPSEDDFRRPLKLLARSLAFVDPLSGSMRRFESTRSL